MQQLMEKLTFSELERTIHEYQMSESRRIMQEILEEADQYILENRDEQLYKTAKKSCRSIKTVFGVVTFIRQGYKVGSRSGDTEHIYLLDKMLTTETVGNFSLAVAKEIKRLRDEKLSYKEISDKLKDIAGIVVTRAAIPNVLFGLEEYFEAPEAKPE